MMVKIEYRSNIAHLIMNRPDVNAIDLTFVEDFHSALDDLEKLMRFKTADTIPIRLLIIESAIPEYFSFGFDLPTLAQSEYHYIHRTLTSYLELIRRLILLPIPVLALIQGRCIAGGMVLALSADYRIATGNKCRFMLNEVNLNIPFPSGIVQLVECICGIRESREILTRGKSLHADEAMAAGIIDKYVSNEKLAEVMQSKIRYFISRPAFGFQKLKEARMSNIANSMALDLRREKIDELLTDISTTETKEKIKKLLTRLDRLNIRTSGEK